MDVTSMNVALASPRNSEIRISERRPACGAFVPIPSRWLMAMTAASLSAHGCLVAAVLREAPPDTAVPVRVIPLEVVMEPPAVEKQRADSPSEDSQRAPEAMQNRQERRGDLEQKQAAPLSFASGTERAPRDSKFGNEKPVHAESQMKTAAADRFRAVAVPLPSKNGDEAMSYRFIVGGMLERVKHYPEYALQRGAKGAATIGFVLDGSCGVASVLLRSSGEAKLDAESVALVVKIRQKSPSLVESFQWFTTYGAVPNV